MAFTVIFKRKTFKQKLVIRAAITLALALVLAATLVFSPERVSGRQSAYTWLESGPAGEAARVELKGETETTLVRRGGAWFVEYSGREYPAKPGAVEDLFKALTAKGIYAPRGGAVSSHERLGLDEETASRIIVSGDTGGPPFLTLLVGGGDATGKEVYYRKAGQDEVRSGGNTIAAFLSYSRPSWYDLKIFPDGETLNTEQVYRVTVIAPPPGESGEDAAGENAPPLVIQRTGSGWTVEGLAPEETDANRAETFVRQLLDCTADDYVPEMNAGEAVFNEGRILVEFSGLPARTIRLGPPLAYSEEDGSVTRRGAVQGDSPYVFALSSWTMARLFRDREYFKRPQ
ncbi:MAG: DUF4340 domain-containing protein [Treponema sp.]|jgi:hypothetical protein|nr:DUF4340 domain-containing protein [Treponema sp.]